MCGIIALINTLGQPVSRDRLRACSDLLEHRGPDHGALYTDGPIGLANRRLAIIDPDPRANQPMRYGHYWITYNGAIYNYIELRQLLAQKGYSFQTESDTEVLLAAYDHWGDDCVSRFNGMWAFAIYDQRKERFFCSRDRFGIKPLYYTNVGHTFGIASEIKAFTALPGWEARVNRPALHAYVRYGMQDFSAETLFKDVFHVPAGHNLIFDLAQSTFDIRAYYTPPRERASWSFNDACHRFLNIFTDVIRLRFRADVSIGACLSGGLDSSSIASIAASEMPHVLREKSFTTISAVFPGTAVDESTYIKALCDQTGLPNTAVTPTWDALNESIDHVLWHQDEPFSSMSVLAQHALFRAAKNEGCTVMLDGQGGDEILAGYDTFFLPFFKQLFRKRPWAFFGEAVAFFRHYKGSLIDGAQRLRRQRSKGFDHPEPWLDLPDFEHLMPDLLTKADTMQNTSIRLLTTMGLPVLLHYEDRNSMAHGVESRLPFLDHRLVEFCLSLPDQFKISGGKRKHLLREAMKGLLPESIRSRNDKMGFETPQRQWMQQHASDMNAVILRFSKTVDFLHFADTAAIAKLDMDTKWRLYVLNRWLSVFQMS